MDRCTPYRNLYLRTHFRHFRCYSWCQGSELGTLCLKPVIVSFRWLKLSALTYKIESHRSKALAQVVVAPSRGGVSSDPCYSMLPRHIDQDDDGLRVRTGECAGGSFWEAPGDPSAVAAHGEQLALRGSRPSLDEAGTLTSSGLLHLGAASLRMCDRLGPTEKIPAPNSPMTS
jgi:hypothetical protein